MTGKLRGLQLFRQLCRTKNTSSSCTSQPPFDVTEADLLQRSARSFSALPARDLASDSVHIANTEQTPRQQQHQAHAYLLSALQAALIEAHAAPGNKRSSARRTSNRILREFAPLKLVLSAANDEQSKENLHMLEKWEQQLEIEWSTVERLRSKYVEQSQKLRQMGRGDLLIGTKSMMSKWFPALRDAIAEEQAAVRPFAGYKTTCRMPLNSCFHCSC